MSGREPEGVRAAAKLEGEAEGRLVAGVAVPDGTAYVATTDQLPVADAVGVDDAGGRKMETAGSVALTTICDASTPVSAAASARNAAKAAASEPSAALVASRATTSLAPVASAASTAEPSVPSGTSDLGTKTVSHTTAYSPVSAAARARAAAPDAAAAGPNPGLWRPSRRRPEAPESVGVADADADGDGDGASLELPDDDRLPDEDTVEDAVVDTDPEPVEVSDFVLLALPV